jgi:hypothetical protein
MILASITRENRHRELFWLLGFALVLSLGLCSTTRAQKKRPARQSATKTKTAPASPQTELEKLHDEYIKATKDYKASLEKLLPLYEKNQHTAEQKLEQSKELFKQGLISKREMDDAEQASLESRARIADVRKQMTDADAQVASALLEIETDKKIGKLPKGGFVRSASLIRYAGAGPWALSQVGKIDAFFRQRFGRPLPIAVFGQGPIHNQWRLDHRNAMDVSVNPNGPEAQPLMDFLRANGIPFSAFRSAIPGVATGPHIHIGLPSHRY